MGLNHSPPRGGPGNNTSVLAKNDDQKKEVFAMFGSTRTLRAMAQGFSCALEFGPKGQQKGVISGAVEVAFAMKENGIFASVEEIEAFLAECGIKLVFSKGVYRGELA